MSSPYPLRTQTLQLIDQTSATISHKRAHEEIEQPSDGSGTPELEVDNSMDSAVPPPKKKRHVHWEDQEVRFVNFYGF